MKMQNVSFGTGLHIQGYMDLEALPNKSKITSSVKQTRDALKEIKNQDSIHFTVRGIEKDGAVSGDLAIKNAAGKSFYKQPLTLTRKFIDDPKLLFMVLSNAYENAKTMIHTLGETTVKEGMEAAMRKL